MPKLRVAMISEHADPLADLGGVDAGGQNVHVAQLAASLVRRGHEVRVYTRRDARDAPRTVLSRDGYLVVRVPAGPPIALPKDDLLPYMAEFGHWLEHTWSDREFAPDVVHAHFWMSGLAAMTAVEHQRRPLVVTYHALGSVKHRMQGPLDTSPPTRIMLERRVGQAATSIIAQCRDEVQELARYGLPLSKIEVVPSGVDTQLFTPAGAADGDGHRRVLSVGRLVPRKGFADLIRAIRQLPEVQLLIAGGPPADQLEREPHAVKLRELAEQLGVSARVHLLGAIPYGRMADIYRSADVLACAPEYEPFGITPLEAMACGLPVVTYAVGGLKDSVRHHVTGVQVPARDIDALAAELGSLLADQDRRRQYGRAAAQLARSSYSWASIAEKVELVYRLAQSRHLSEAGIHMSFSG